MAAQTRCLECGACTDHDGGSDTVELVLGGRQHQEGLGLLLHQPQQRGGEARVQLGQQQGEEVEGGGGGELPLQLLQHHHLHGLQLGQAAAAVRGHHQLVQGQRPRVAQLRGEAEAGRGQELQLRGREAHLGQHRVQVGHGAQEHLP